MAGQVTRRVGGEEDGHDPDVSIASHASREAAGKKDAGRELDRHRRHPADAVFSKKPAQAITGQEPREEKLPELGRRERPKVQGTCRQHAQLLFDAGIDQDGQYAHNCSRNEKSLPWARKEAGLPPKERNRRDVVVVKQRQRHQGDREDDDPCARRRASAECDQRKAREEQNERVQGIRSCLLGIPNVHRCDRENDGRDAAGPFVEHDSAKAIDEENRCDSGRKRYGSHHPLVVTKNVGPDEHQQRVPGGMQIAKGGDGECPESPQLDVRGPQFVVPQAV
jgi:hypothetical protein